MTVTSSVLKSSSLRAILIMIGLGLPKFKAYRLEAVSRKATVDPQPGRIPPSIGQLGSKLVAINFAPSIINFNAFSSTSKLIYRPSPTTT